jgi:hypothetical protein
LLLVDAFSKERKATISFVMSACPSASPHETTRCTKCMVENEQLNKPRIKRKTTQHCSERCLRALMRFVITKVAFRQEGGFSLTERTTAYRNLTHNISRKETAKTNEMHNCRNKFRYQNRRNLKIQDHGFVTSSCMSATVP